MKPYVSTCVRCGKTRVLLKTWEEDLVTYTGVSMVKRALYVCPDAKCQAKVEASLAEKKRVAKEREEVAEQRKRNHRPASDVKSP